MPVYEEKYLETNLKSYKGNTNTGFCDKKNTRRRSLMHVFFSNSY